MSAISNSVGVAGASSLNLSGVDIETALMAVQQKRSELLENQLRGQMEGVQARNQQMAAMNDQISGLTKMNTQLETSNVQMTGELAGLKDLQSRLEASKCPNPEGSYGLSWGQGDNAQQSHDTFAQVKAAGLTIPTGADAPRDIDGNGTMDAKGKVVQGWVDQLAGKIADMEAKIKANTDTVAANKDQIDTTKRDMDGLSSTQQLEMLRLQSLSNKRNEAFDVMTNFVKKMQDSRSSIIGNMR